MADEQQVIPAEQVLAQLKTRGFDEGFSRTPLRDFRGRLISITGAMVTRMTPPRMEVIYNFTEVEVLASTEPYVNPVAQITMLHSTRRASGSGILGASIDSILNAGMEKEPEMVLAADGVTQIPNPKIRRQEFLIGKVQEWRMTPGHPIWSKAKGAEVPTDCWEVVWVEGFGSSATIQLVMPQSAPQMAPVAQTAKPSSAQEALRLLDGKTEQQFNQAIFNSDVVKADMSLVQKILQKQFLGPLLIAGQISMDAQGIYHVAK